MEKTKFCLERTWEDKLKDTLKTHNYKKIVSFVFSEKQKYVVYPPLENVFRWSFLCPFDCVKVVILGQDPYHGKKQATGLAFSVPIDQPIPPSLKNIHKELKDDVNIQIPKHGSLEKWTKEGVLLLNTTLTVREKTPFSHSNCGWTFFTDNIIKKISEEKTGVVFLLWGKHAQKKEFLINKTKHFVLKAAHPSPFSANHGFFGCKHFSLTNNYLSNKINWNL